LYSKDDKSKLNIEYFDTSPHVEVPEIPEEDSNWKELDVLMAQRELIDAKIKNILHGLRYKNPSI